jgi:hypothetical protein
MTSLVPFFHMGYRYPSEEPRREETAPKTGLFHINYWMFRVFRAFLPPCGIGSDTLALFLTSSVAQISRPEQHHQCLCQVSLSLHLTNNTVLHLH